MHRASSLRLTRGTRDLGMRRASTSSCPRRALARLPGASAPRSKLGVWKTPRRSRGMAHIPGCRSCGEIALASCITCAPVTRATIHPVAMRRAALDLSVHNFGIQEYMPYPRDRRVFPHAYTFERGAMPRETRRARRGHRQVRGGASLRSAYLPVNRKLDARCIHGDTQRVSRDD